MIFQTRFRRLARRCALGAILGGLTITAANAEDVTADPPSSDWEFSVTPYLWATGEKGDVGVIPGTDPVNLDLRFSDIFHNLKFAAMSIMQARKGRFVAMADVAYVKVGADKDIGIRDPEFIEADLTSTSFTATLAGGYRAMERGPMYVDLMGGMRITSSKTELDLTGPLNSVSGARKETWVDPVVGMRFHTPLAEKWAAVIYGDIGGFGVSSDLTWQLQGAIQYRIGKQWWLAAGWRYYAIDYDKDDFIYDVRMSGPITGISYRF